MGAVSMVAGCSTRAFAYVDLPPTDSAIAAKVCGALLAPDEEFPNPQPTVILSREKARRGDFPATLAD
jgi:hypothetical protein